MSLTARQAAILVVAVVVGIGLIAYGFSHPGCGVYAFYESTVICSGNGSKLGGTDRGPIYQAVGVGVILLGIVLALSPWGRKQGG